VLRYFGDLEGADIAVTAALALDPQSAENHVAAAWVAFFAGRYASSRAHFAEALRCSPTSTSAKYGMLWALRARFFFMRPVIGTWKIFRRGSQAIAKLRAGFATSWLCGLFAVFAVPLLFVPFLLVLAELVLFQCADYLLLFDHMACQLMSRSRQHTIIACSSLLPFLALFWLLFVWVPERQWNDNWPTIYTYLFIVAALPPIPVLLRPRRLRASACSTAFG